MENYVNKKKITVIFHTEGGCDTVRLSAYILCNIMSLYLNCCLELKTEILKYMFRFQGQAIDFSM